MARASRHDLAVSALVISPWSASFMGMRPCMSLPPPHAPPERPPTCERPETPLPSGGGGSQHTAHPPCGGLVWGNQQSRRDGHRPRPVVPHRRSLGRSTLGVRSGLYGYASRRVFVHDCSAHVPETGGGVLYTPSVDRDHLSRRPRTPEAGIHQVLWPANGFTLHPHVYWDCIPSSAYAIFSYLISYACP
jgi:hypothetical protein